MENIAIYGAGGLGREVAAMIAKIKSTSQAPQINIVGFFDDGKSKGAAVSHWGTVLGGIDDLNQWPTPLGVVLAIGAPRTIAIIHNKILNPVISYPNIISPDFEISDASTFAMGMGNIIKGGCFASTDVKLGNFNLLNGDVVFGHDAEVGDFNVFMPGVRVSGEVKISNSCMFGSMSFVHQKLIVPDNVTLSPLSSLLTRPKQGGLYMGNPAKLVKL